MILKKVFLFYWDGFRNLSPHGKKLWLIILIKLFVLYFILKPLFFPKILETSYATDEERIEHVEKELLP